MAHPAVAAAASEPVRVVGDTRDRQQLVHAARGQDEPVVADLVGYALRARPAHHFLLGIDMVHRAEHEPHLAQSAGQLDTDVSRLDHLACHLGHQRKVQEVIRRVDHHDLGRVTNQPGQFPCSVEAGETRPDDHDAVLFFATPPSWLLLLVKVAAVNATGFFGDLGPTVALGGC